MHYWSISSFHNIPWNLQRNECYLNSSVSVYSSVSWELFPVSLEQLSHPGAPYWPVIKLSVEHSSPLRGIHRTRGNIRENTAVCCCCLWLQKSLFTSKRIISQPLQFLLPKENKSIVNKTSVIINTLSLSVTAPAVTVASSFSINLLFVLSAALFLYLPPLSHQRPTQRRLRQTCERASCLLTALLRNLAVRSASWSNNWKQINPEECFHANSAAVTCSIHLFSSIIWRWMEGLCDVPGSRSPAVTQELPPDVLDCCFSQVYFQS